MAAFETELLAVLEQAHQDFVAMREAIAALAERQNEIINQLEWKEANHDDI